LTQECYRSMFAACTSLTALYVLPATKLERGCYEHMLCYCENIKELPLIPKQILNDALRMSLFS